VLTPHIAGSVGTECRRMGRAMVEELERFVAGRPLRFGVSREDAANTSHRPMAHGHNGESQTFVRSSAFAAAPSAG
jgi:hypothetical protein